MLVGCAQDIYAYNTVPLKPESRSGSFQPLVNQGICKIQVQHHDCHLTEIWNAGLVRFRDKCTSGENFYPVPSMFTLPVYEHAFQCPERDHY